MTLVMEHAEDGDLRAPKQAVEMKRSHLEEGLIKRWLRQMLEGLAYIHRQKVVHRDLKASNVFLRDIWRTAQLGDFGISTVLSTHAFNDSCVGTPAYMSPETVRNDRCDFAVDMWGIGVILYELMALKMPFKGSSLLALVYQISFNTPEETPLRAGGYSDTLVQLVLTLMSKEPQDRPRASALLEEAALWDDFSMADSELMALEAFEKSSEASCSSPSGAAPALADVTEDSIGDDSWSGAMSLTTKHLSKGLSVKDGQAVPQIGVCKAPADGEGDLSWPSGEGGSTDCNLIGQLCFSSRDTEAAETDAVAPGAHEQQADVTAAPAASRGLLDVPRHWNRMQVTSDALREELHRTHQSDTTLSRQQFETYLAHLNTWSNKPAIAEPSPGAQLLPEQSAETPAEVQQGPPLPNMVEESESKNEEEEEEEQDPMSKAAATQPEVAERSSTSWETSPPDRSPAETSPERSPEDPAELIRRTELFLRSRGLGTTTLTNFRSRGLGTTTLTNFRR